MHTRVWKRGLGGPTIQYNKNIPTQPFFFKRGRKPYCKIGFRTSAPLLKNLYICARAIMSERRKFWNLRQMGMQFDDKLSQEPLVLHLFPLCFLDSETSTSRKQEEQTRRCKESKRSTPLKQTDKIYTTLFLYILQCMNVSIRLWVESGLARCYGSFRNVKCNLASKS